MLCPSPDPSGRLRGINRVIDIHGRYLGPPATRRTQPSMIRRTHRNVIRRTQPSMIRRADRDMIRRTHGDVIRWTDGWTQRWAHRWTQPRTDRWAQRRTSLGMIGRATASVRCVRQQHQADHDHEYEEPRKLCSALTHMQRCHRFPPLLTPPSEDQPLRQRYTRRSTGYRGFRARRVRRRRLRANHARHAVRLSVQQVVEALAGCLSWRR